MFTTEQQLDQLINQIAHQVVDHTHFPKGRRDSMVERVTEELERMTIMEIKTMLYDIRQGRRS